MAKYVEVERRDKAAFDTISWDYGDRPNWWRQTQLVWVFDCDRPFSTRDLEVAEVEISDRYPHLADELIQLTLFLHVPLTPPDKAKPFDIPLVIEARHVAAFARETWTRLNRMRGQLKQLEISARDLIVNSAEELAAQTPYEHAKHIFDTDGFFGAQMDYGLTPKQMLDLARGMGAYELESLCHRVAEEQRTRASEHRSDQLSQTHERAELRWFLDAMRKSYFIPETREEARALDLHRKWEHAWNEPRNRTKYAAERDAYIAQHVVNKIPDTALGKDEQ